ncbi:MAG: Gfo/Idh/MocA family oxidoreductase [candidate division KSB1 bacterium]|nr:Gfo/Idh/MocA family oxidoreductase [candidate division KSB1 bacterium]
MQKLLNISRRTFIRAAGAASLVAPAVIKRAGAQTELLNIGLIGCGWYGMLVLNKAFDVGGVNCVALCDVDSEHLKNSADKVEENQGRRPELYQDYRELLEHSGLQAVIIATPPHWHALPFLAALEQGLDIYCEKPLAYDIREGQVMVEAAQNSDSIVQIGFQRRQSQAILQARDAIQSGAIGDVVQVDTQIHYNAPIRDTEPQNPPESLDWEFWCGPAPKLPYRPNIGHIAWRLEKAYGNGHLVDWGIHWIDAIRLILDEDMPFSVNSSGGIIHLKDQITTPDTLTTYFEFETCPVVWRHRLWGAKEYPGEPTNGMFFYGTQGTLFVNGRKWVVVSNKKGAEPEEHNVKTDSAKGHMADFLNAVASRRQPDCTVADAFLSTATVQLGMISWEAHQRINWDAQNQQIINNTRANEKLRREYRKPWVHPYSVKSKD